MSARKQKPGSAAGYAVGYGKPPEQTRFRPGVSGNPRGRPKGSLNIVTVLRKALHERVEVTDKGRVRRISKFELAVTQLVNRAVKGDARATQQILSLAPLLEDNASVAADPLDSDDTAVLAALIKRLGRDG